MGITQQFGQRGTGPRGDDSETLGRGFLHPGVDQAHLKTHRRRRRAQKGAFLGRGLEQGNFQVRPHRRQHQAGKSRAGTQITQIGRFLGDMAGKLGAVPHMAAPQIVQAGAGHQIVTAVPVGQKTGIDLQPLQCFM